jgi:2,3-bisphosphoglycerate-independent phosphoglycerate mutase
MTIKGADEAGHDGKSIQKRDVIEVIDAALDPLLALSDTLLVVCADHSTPCSVRDHSADPVPVVIRGPGVRTDRTDRFDEVSCAEGGLHRIRGCDLMPIALDLINKSHKYGA